MTDSDEVELALWYDAKKYKKPTRVVDESIKEALHRMCQSKGYILRNVRYDILKPGGDRVPKVPMWLENTKGARPRLLVATARVKKKSNINQHKGIVNDLDEKQLTHLRAITRRQHMKAYPNQKEQLTDAQCDDLINQIGMDVVMDQLRSTTLH